MLTIAGCVVAIGALAACSVELPGRTFKAGNFECSEGPTKIAISKEVLTIHPLLGEDAKDAPPDLTGLMKACGDFLAEH